MQTQERVKEAKAYRKKYKQNAIKMKQDQALKNQKKENENGEKRVEWIWRVK